MRLLLVALCGWGLVQSTLCAAQSTLVSDQEKFLVRVEIDFDNKTPGAITPADLARWSAEQGIAKAFEDKDGGTATDVLQRYITRTNPKAKQHALELNGVSPSQVFPSGSQNISGAKPLWVAPLGSSKILPAVSGSPKARPLVTYSSVPDSDRDRLLSPAGRTGELSVLVPDIPDSDRNTPKRKAIQLELTRAQVLSLQTTLPAARVLTIKGKFQVSTAASKVVGPRPLEEGFKKILETAFNGRPAPSKKPLLIVVDDSWPTDADFLATKNLIGTVYPELWRINSDMAAASDAPELLKETKELGSPGIPLGKNCVDIESCDTHARRVHYSLLPLRNLAKVTIGEEPVDVIYIPLTAAQKASRDILRLLWNLAYAAGTEIAPNSPTFFAEELTRARQEREFLDSLEEKITGSEFVSNWAILTSVNHFARQYALLKQVPVFISLSWTTEDITFNPPVLTAWNTLVVAAAGNHCKDDKCGKFAYEVGPQRLFVRRAASPSDVLLVVNVNADGVPSCNTSRVPVSYSVVGFEGAIEGDCGTSFSTPRVAWLLASRSAFSRIINPGATEQSEYLKWILSRPKRRTCSSDDDFKCIYLSPSEIMAALPKRAD